MIVDDIKAALSGLSLTTEDGRAVPVSVAAETDKEFIEGRLPLPAVVLRSEDAALEPITINGRLGEVAADLTLSVYAKDRETVESIIEMIKSAVHDRPLGEWSRVLITSIRERSALERKKHARAVVRFDVEIEAKKWEWW